MNISVIDNSKPYNFEVYSQAKEELKEQAQANVCSCYYYQLADCIDDLTWKELQEFVDNSFQGHVNDNSYIKDCPDWQQGYIENNDQRMIEERS